MFKDRFLICMVFLLNIFFAQISQAEEMKKTTILASKLDGYIFEYALSVTEYYNSDFTVEEYSFALGAQNDKYSHVEDLFIIVGGDAQKVYNFTKWVLAFINTCKIERLQYPIDIFDISIEYHNWGSLLGKIYYVSRGNERHGFKKKDIERIQKKLLEYCQKQNIYVDTTIPVEINPALGENR